MTQAVASPTYTFAPPSATCTVTRDDSTAMCLSANDTIIGTPTWSVPQPMTGVYGGVFLGGRLVISTVDILFVIVSMAVVILVRRWAERQP